MKAHVMQQQDSELLALGYTIQVNVTPDDDTTDVVDIRDFKNVETAGFFIKRMGYEYVSYIK